MEPKRKSNPLADAGFTEFLACFIFLYLIFAAYICLFDSVSSIARGKKP